MPHHSEPHGKALGCSGGRRRKGKRGHEPLLWFFSGKARQGRVSTSGLASLKNFSRLCWGVGTSATHSRCAVRAGGG